MSPTTNPVPPGHGCDLGMCAEFNPPPCSTGLALIPTPPSNPGAAVHAPTIPASPGETLQEKLNKPGPGVPFDCAQPDQINAESSDPCSLDVTSSECEITRLQGKTDWLEAEIYAMAAHRAELFAKPTPAPSTSLTVFVTLAVVGFVMGVTRLVKHLRGRFAKTENEAL